MTDPAATGDDLISETEARQRAAADPASSAWVAANAGTGKTHVLVNRVARLLLSGAHPSRILCITYTRAAAAEMTTRLFEQLGNWSLLNDDALTRTLNALQDAEVTAKQVRRARQLFARALETPGGLKIQTIHAFCQSILSRFPVEARINPNFRLVEELQAAELRAQARSNLLRIVTSGSDAELCAAHVRLLNHIGDDQYDDLLTAATFKAEDLDALIDKFPNLEAVWQTMWRHLGLSPGATAETIIQDACADDSGDVDQLMRTVEALYQGAETSKEKAARIEAFWKAADRTALFDDYLDCFLTKSFTLRAKLTTKAVDSVDAEAEEILKTEQMRLKAVHDRRQAAKLAAMSRAALTIAYRFLKEYEQLKVREGALDFADMIRFTNGLLTEDREAWVHYKLDQGVDHVLIDEAQDTSPKQWHVIRQLTREMTSGLGAADDKERQRTIFAVGDVKQSIYRFQGADPDQFAGMRSYFGAALADAKKAFRPLELDLSFRSAAPILEAVDATFANEPLSTSAHDVGIISHSTVHVEAPGLVELWPPILAEDVDAQVPWDIPLDSVPPTSPAGQLANEIARKISGWLESKEHLPGAGRPIRPADILILVRQRGAFMEHMIRALKQYTVPVAGADRLKTTSHIAVKDLMAVGRFALLPSDDLTLATILRSPLVGLTENDLFELAHGREGTLWSALSQRAKESGIYQSSFDWLSEVRDRADFMSPFEFFSRVLIDDNGRAKLLARLGPDAEDPLDEFLTRALQHERLHPPSLEHFLHTIAASEGDIKRDLEKEANEVRVITVHGAKGLQSEIVFCPDTCTKPRGGSERGFLFSKMQDDDDLDSTRLPLFSIRAADDDPIAAVAREVNAAETDAEYRRLLYVAMTRAKERLYICGFAGTRGPQKGSWHPMVEKALSDIGQPFETPLGQGWRLSKDGPTRQSVAPVGTADIAQEESPTWARTAPPLESARRRLSPSSLGEDDSDAPAVFAPTEANQAAIQRGNLVHRLLETLPDLPVEERAEAAHAYLNRFASDLDKAARDDLARETLALFELPEAKVIFGLQSRAETGIGGTVTINGVEEIIEGRIDRLAVTDDAVWVVDYKTNRPAPTDINNVASTYIRQMAAYRAVLKGVYPGRMIRAALLWTHGPHLMELPEELLEKEWAEMCASPA